ncbi:MAG: replicative DNA helicase [Erysipelotrichaceae bacterium]|nr:replicative DNA helicase [Erysipelotrichaceae bacterium]
MAELPHSSETEQALLGSLIEYPNTFVKAEDLGLVSEDFFVGSHQELYGHLQDMYRTGKPIELRSVVAFLNDKKALTKCGGVDYISDLVDMAISSENSEYYIRVIKNKSTLRKLIEEVRRIENESFDSAKDVEDILDKAEKNILRITRDVKAGEFHSGRQVMSEVQRQINMLQNRQEMTGVRTGYNELDRITYGFQKGDLIIVAARPSVGKTAFALNIATRAACDFGAGVALFSLEMPYLQIGMRILSARANVDSYRIRTGRNLDNEDWAKMKVAMKAIGESNLYIDDSSSITIREITAKCRKLKAEGKLDMIVIDYLQLISSAGSARYDNRQVEVSEISRNLKGLAREMNVPVIALSQLSRSVETRSGDKKPILSDLRESGSIEQDADIVMFLHRPDYYNKDKTEDDGDKLPDSRYEANIIIAKHRNGSIGEISLMFQPNTNAFLPLAVRKEYSED